MSKYYVYTITDKSYVKIGITTNITNRIRALQTGNSSKLLLAGYTECGSKAEAVELEKYLHTKYAKYNTIGEWFDMATDKIYKENGRYWYIQVPNNGTLFLSNNGGYWIAGNGKEFDGTYHYQMYSIKLNQLEGCKDEAK